MAAEFEPPKKSGAGETKTPKTVPPPNTEPQRPWYDDDGDGTLEFHPDEDPYGPCYDPD